MVNVVKDRELTEANEKIGRESRELREVLRQDHFLDIQEPPLSTGNSCRTATGSPPSPTASR